MRRFSRPLATLTVTSAAIAIGWAALAQAQPAPPTFATFYGQVLVGGENLDPVTQPVIAFVNGKSCGVATQTLIAEPGEGVPEDDVGKTVYVIDVLADGSDNYERIGCGHPGDPITLYFPVAGRTSTTQPLFQALQTRADIDLDISLSHSAGIPSLAADGVN